MDYPQLILVHADLPMDRRVMLVNARSVSNNTILIHGVMVDEVIDLACITKAWFWCPASALGHGAGSRCCCGLSENHPAHGKTCSALGRPAMFASDSGGT